MKRRSSRVAAAWTAGRIAGRRLLGRRASTVDQRLGAQLAGQLDRLKGLGMKLGQIVSYLDVPLPPAVQEELAALQTGAAARPFSEVRALVEDALGAPLDARFDAFEETAVAAASIGQVHRAEVAGRPVAVKVRYPDVAETLDGDLGVLERVAGLAALGAPIDGRALVRELRARLLEECDYEKEAREQTRFRQLFEDDRQVVVPPVLPTHSTEAVLTSAWVEGARFEDFAKERAERRGDAARTIARFAYRSLLVHGRIQADPHPGNYLFPAEGGVAFLDYGCVRSFDAPLPRGPRPADPRGGRGRPRHRGLRHRGPRPGRAYAPLRPRALLPSPAAPPRASPGGPLRLHAGLPARRDGPQRPRQPQRPRPRDAAGLPLGGAAPVGALARACAPRRGGPARRAPRRDPGRSRPALSPEARPLAARAGPGVVPGVVQIRGAGGAGPRREGPDDRRRNRLGRTGPDGRAWA